MQVPVPQIAFDLSQQTGQIDAFIRVWVADPLHILLHDGDAHCDVEPVKNMFGRRSHIAGDVLDGITTIGHEGDRLVFLPPGT